MSEQTNFQNEEINDEEKGILNETMSEIQALVRSKGLACYVALSFPGGAISDVVLDSPRTSVMINEDGSLILSSQPEPGETEEKKNERVQKVTNSIAIIKGMFENVSVAKDNFKSVLKSINQYKNN